MMKKILLSMILVIFIIGCNLDRDKNIDPEVTSGFDYIEGVIDKVEIVRTGWFSNSTVLYFSDGTVKVYSEIYNGNIYKNTLIRVTSACSGCPIYHIKKINKSQLGGKN